MVKLGGSKEIIGYYYEIASVAFALNEKDLRAAKLLGAFHHAASGMPEPSPYLACYYLNIATNGDKDGAACYFYSKALWQLIEYLHDGNITITGFSAVPILFFWLRKSCDLGDSEALEQLKEWKTTILERKKM